MACTLTTHNMLTQTLRSGFKVSSTAMRDVTRRVSGGTQCDRIFPDSQMHLKDADRLRLAVATAILRSKPKEASVTCYVLDLRVRLPQSQSAPFTANCHWRTYALRLEIELKQLQEQHEIQKTKLLALTDDTPPERSSSDYLSKPQARSNAFATGTKKKKATAHKTPGSNDVKIIPEQDPQSDSETAFQGVCDQVRTAIPRGSELLLPSLWAFGKTVSGHKNGSTLLQMTLQTLCAISRALKTILNHTTTRAADYVTLTVIGRVLQHVVTSSLRPIYIRQNVATPGDLELSDIDKVFDCLISDVFRPAIRAFKQMTQAFFASLRGDLPFPKDGSENRGAKIVPHLRAVDLRPGLLGLLQTLVDSLRLASSSIHFACQLSGKQEHPRSRGWAVSLSSLKASLNLEVIRELKRILFPTQCEERSGANGTEAEPDYHKGRQDNVSMGSRVLDYMVPDSVDVPIPSQSFIVKDALWYLCSLMHSLADLPLPGLDAMPISEPRHQHPSKAGNEKEGDGTIILGLLHDAVLSALYDLLLKCQQTIDQVKTDPNQYGRGATPLANEPNNETRHPLDIIRNSGNHNPEEASRVGFSLTNSDEGMTWDSEVQVPSTDVTYREPEVGDPSGRDLNTLSDNNTLGELAGGVRCITDARAYDSANNGGSWEVTGLSTQPLSENQGELRVYSPDRRRPPTECLIDEGGFTMLLGVVERYILDPEYAG